MNHWSTDYTAVILAHARLGLITDIIAYMGLQCIDYSMRMHTHGRTKESLLLKDLDILENIAFLSTLLVISDTLRVYRLRSGMGVSD